jgi:FAD/FMN-containing dehydrogenase
MTLMSWGMYPKIKNTSLTFSSDKSLEELISNNRGVIPYGNGRSYGDSALNAYIIKTRNHDYFIEFDEKNGLLHVQAGVLLSEILESFVPRGWFLKVTPGTKLITVGGAIASDVHGKNHHIEGCFSECIRDFRIMTPDGEIVNCSRVDTPELFKATCGGQGLTGVILSARIYLKKINSIYLDQTTIKTNNLKETFDAFEEHNAYPYSVAWIDCLAKGKDIGRSLLMLGKFRDDGCLHYQSNSKFSIPCNFPSFTLNRWSITAFNKLYYSRVKNRITKEKVDIDTFFYPLDSIRSWNRMYGKHGFIQYQFILPIEHSYDGLHEVLNKIADAGKGSFLAVLKLYGKANDNYLSFPLEGYSLAVDFKIEEGIFDLLDELDKVILKYSGRIYLAKDARVSKDVFEKGYPKINEFRKYRKDHKMNNSFQSLQSIRVGI